MEIWIVVNERGGYVKAYKRQEDAYNFIKHHEGWQVYQQWAE